jgi:hypothetical protein
MLDGCIFSYDKESYAVSDVKSTLSEVIKY